MGVIHHQRRAPQVGGMAVLTDVVGSDVIHRLTRGIHAVVARRAVVNDAGVIESRRRPGQSRVAAVALLHGLHVANVFTCRSSTVMARRAGALDMSVIHHQHRAPDVGGMAVFADVVGIDVIDRFAGGIRAVVAGGAVVNDIVMTERGGSPGQRRVADIALQRSLHMTDVLAGRRDTIVTDTATALDVGVIHHQHRAPQIGGMAVLTDVVSRDVVDRLAGSRDAIVATAAAVNDAVVREVGRRPRQRRMTSVALRIRGNVVG